MKNQLKTMFFLVILTFLLLLVGSFVGGLGGLTIAFAFSILMNFGAYFWSDKIVLKMYKADEIQKKDNKELFKIVSQVVNLAKIPMPKIYVVPSQSPNAFATGRNPEHSAIAFTEGILSILKKEELKGVIAHELSHIKNRDTLVQTVTASIVGVISYIAMMTRFATIFGGFGGRDRNSNLFEILILAIVMPLLAMVIQMAISRSREFLADEKAAKILHTGNGLASALEKLDYYSKRKQLKLGNESTSSLFIVNPFHRGAFVNLLSTHPPIKKRIKILKSF